MVLVGIGEAERGGRAAGERLHAIDGGVIGERGHLDGQHVPGVLVVAEHRGDIPVLTGLDQFGGAAGQLNACPQAGVAPLQRSHPGRRRRRLPVGLFVQGLVFVIHHGRIEARVEALHDACGDGLVDVPGRYGHLTAIARTERTGRGQLDVQRQLGADWR